MQASIRIAACGVPRPVAHALWLRPGGLRALARDGRFGDSRARLIPSWAAFSTAKKPPRQNGGSGAIPASAAASATALHACDHNHHHHHGDAAHAPALLPSLSERFARGEGLLHILLTSTNRKSGGRMAAVALGCLLSWMDVAALAGLPFDVIGATTTILGGWPVLKEASAHLRARKVTLSLSMSIGILAALGTGETFVSSLMTLVVLVSEEMEHLTVEKSRASVRNMVATLPEEADAVQADGSVRKVPLGSVRPGDVVRVTAGALVPVDGDVAAGSGLVNEASITGEAMPVRKQRGDAVFAGSINQGSMLDVRASAVGDATVYGRVATTVQQAEGHRAPIEGLAEKVARAVVYFAFASSAATLAATGAVSNAVSVLVVAGACGIAAGTPLAIIGGIGRAARGGCVIKGGQHLEALASANMIVFDKTGTLTRGKPAVVSAQALDSAFPESRLYAVVHAAESRSDHPMARAVAVFAAEGLAATAGAGSGSSTGLAVTEHEELQGLGVSCRVDGAPVLVGNAALLERYGVDVSQLAAEKTTGGGSGSSGSGSGSRGGTVPAAAQLHEVSSRVCVAVDGKLVGVLRVADAVRPEAIGVLKYLREQKIRGIILSGDRSDVVSAVAEDLGIAEAYSEQSPLQKAEFIEKLVAAGHRVAMVGDGINDAAAMAKATVGVAMGQASALTQQVAGVVILHDTLERLEDALRVSKQVQRVIYQNVAGTIGVDLLGTYAAYLGILDPVLAASFHGVWDVAFILNSGRLLMETVPPRQFPGQQPPPAAAAAAADATGRVLLKATAARAAS